MENNTEYLPVHIWLVNWEPWDYDDFDNYPDEITVDNVFRIESYKRKDGTLHRGMIWDDISFWLKNTYVCEHSGFFAEILGPEEYKMPLSEDFTS